MTLANLGFRYLESNCPRIVEVFLPNNDWEKAVAVNCAAKQLIQDIESSVPKYGITFGQDLRVIFSLAQSRLGYRFTEGSGVHKDLLPEERIQTGTYKILIMPPNGCTP